MDTTDVLRSAVDGREFAGKALEAKYKSMDEARKAVDEINKSQLAPWQFCPLSNGQCDAECVCFCNAYVEKSAGGTFWMVRGWECNNPMLIG